MPPARSARTSRHRRFTALRSAAVSARLSLSLDLGAMHDPARGIIKRVAAVHGRSIVPDHKVADAPTVFVNELRRVDELPELVEQRVGFRPRQILDIGIAAPAKIERRFAGDGMDADRGMP